MVLICFDKTNWVSYVFFSSKHWGGSGAKKRGFNMIQTSKITSLYLPNKAMNHATRSQKSQPLAGLHSPPSSLT